METWIGNSPGQTVISIVEDSDNHSLAFVTKDRE
jgi:hypothetical protein